VGAIAPSDKFSQSKLEAGDLPVDPGGSHTASSTDTAASITMLRSSVMRSSQDVMVRWLRVTTTIQLCTSVCRFAI